MNIYIKFGSKENSLDLLKNGTIYCSPIKEFIKYDDDCRYDKDERTTFILNNKIDWVRGHLTSNPDLKFEFTDITKSLFKEHMETPIDNIYCLFSFNLRDAIPWKEYPIHEDMSGFGEYFVLIHNSEEFAKRLSAKLKLSGYTYDHRAIEYTDLTKLNGKKTLFQKDLKYSYQNEVRVLIKTGLTEKFILTLGSIEDIARIYKLSNYNTFIKYKDDNTSQIRNEKAIYLREKNH